EQVRHPRPGGGGDVGAAVEHLGHGGHRHPGGGGDRGQRGPPRTRRRQGVLLYASARALTSTGVTSWRSVPTSRKGPVKRTVSRQGRAARDAATENSTH